MWSMFTHPRRRVGGWCACVSIPGLVRVSEDSKCVQMYVFQTVNAPQNKISSSGSYYITPFIIHTCFFFPLLNLRVIWQTCATVNVRYFPWGKLG